MARHTLFTATIVLFAIAAHSSEVKVKSPDGKTVVTVSDDGGLNYSIASHGREVMGKSHFGIVSDGVDLGGKVVLGKSSSHKIDESYSIFGAHAKAENKCRETTVAVRGEGEAYELDIRAYDDGVALRARLAAKPGRKINGESSEWKLSGNPLAWYQTDFGSYEGIFQSTPLGEFKPEQKVPMPVLFTLPEGGYAMVTEANSVNYSDAGVQVAADHSLHVFFHARSDAAGWTTDDAVVQPWRVTLLAPDLDGLVNSDLIRNLCPPAPRELANAEWIKPGRSSWQWWSSGGPIYSEQHQWVDWTKDLGFEYYLIDEGWKKWKADGKDEWACLREVCDYAKTKNVKIWCWIHSNELPTAERRKDFMDRAVAAGVVSEDRFYSGSQCALGELV